MELLRGLAPDEAKYLAEGREEVEEMAKGAGGAGDEETG